MPPPSAPGAATPSKPLSGVGLALIGFAVFSLHDALIKSVQGIPTFQVAFFAVLFSFVPFSLYLAVARPERSFRPQVPVLMALRCLFTTSGLLCGFYAFNHLPLAEAYSLLFSAPILITLLAIPLLGERVRAFRWFAILLGMAGVLIVLRPGSAPFEVGHLAAIGAAFSLAINSVITRLIGGREHALTMILYPMLANVLLTGLLTTLVYVPMPGEQLSRLAAIGALTVIGQTMLVMAYRKSEAQFVAPMQYSQMLWGLVYGALVFGEAVDTTVLAGAGVIVLSGLLFIWRELVTSVGRPVLQMRNLRVTGGPQVRPVENRSNSAPDDLDPPGPPG